MKYRIIVNSERAETPRGFDKAIKRAMKAVLKAENVNVNAL